MKALAFQLDMHLPPLLMFAWNPKACQGRLRSPCKINVTQYWIVQRSAARLAPQRSLTATQLCWAGAISRATADIQVTGAKLEEHRRTGACSHKLLLKLGPRFLEQICTCIKGHGQWCNSEALDTGLQVCSEEQQHKIICTGLPPDWHADNNDHSSSMMQGRHRLQCHC